MMTRYVKWAGLLALLGVVAPAEAGWRIVLCRPSKTLSHARADAAYAARLEIDAARSELTRAQVAAVRGNPLVADLVKLRVELTEASGRADTRRLTLASATWGTREYKTARNAVADAEAKLAAAKTLDASSAIAADLMALRAALRQIEAAELDKDDEYRTARDDARQAADRVRGAETRINAAAALDPAFLAARERLRHAQARMRREG